MIRPARPADEPRILEIADRLAAFQATSRPPADIPPRERRALSESLAHPAPGSALLVADDAQQRVAGILLLETRHDYFTDQPHGHVSILAVAREAEGQGIGRALLAAAEEWSRGQGFSRMTLTVFVDNHRAREVYARDGWRPELETHYKNLS